MLKIWGRKNSSNVQKVLWTCAELDISFERVDWGGPFGGNQDPTYLAMIKDANLEPDNDTRNNKFAAAESYLIKDQVATIPLFFGLTSWVQKPWVNDLRVAPLNTYIDSRPAWISAH